MEANNYRSVTPLRKKRKKITMTAALILCLVFFVVGIACGRSVSSSKQEKEANAKIQKLEMDYNETLSAHQEKIDTLEGLLNEKKGELADAKKQISDINKAQEEKEEEVKEEKPSEVEPAKVQEDKEEEPQAKGTSSVLRKLIIVCLVIIIIVCILFALSILIKKNDDDDYEDDEDDEEYIEEEYYEDEELETEEDNE